MEEKKAPKPTEQVSKLNEGGHFKGVADVRLRISHFDNADLEKIFEHHRSKQDR